MGDFTNGCIADKQMATLASSNVHGAFLSLFPSFPLFFLLNLVMGLLNAAAPSKKGIYLNQTNFWKKHVKINNK